MNGKIPTEAMEHAKQAWNWIKMLMTNPEDKQQKYWKIPRHEILENIKNAMQECGKILKDAHAKAPSRQKRANQKQVRIERLLIKCVFKMIAADLNLYDWLRHTDASLYGRKSTRIWVIVAHILKWCRKNGITKNIGWLEEIAWVRIIAWRDWTQLPEEPSTQAIIGYFHSTMKEAMSEAGVRQPSDPASKAELVVIMIIIMIVQKFAESILRITEVKGEVKITMKEMMEEIKQHDARTAYAKSIYGRLVEAQEDDWMNTKMEL